MKINELLKELGIENPPDGIQKLIYDMKLSPGRNLMNWEEETIRTHFKCKYWRPLSEEEIQAKHQEFSDVLNKPIIEIFDRYTPLELFKTAKEYKIQLPENILNILDYLLDINFQENFSPSQDPEVIKYLKKEQYEAFPQNDMWRDGTFKMGLGAEIEFEKTCRYHKLDVIDLNLKNGPFCKQDFEVSGKLIDVKSRCFIGYHGKRVFDHNLSQKFFEPGEIIAFYTAKSISLGDDISYTLQGIYDPELVWEGKFKHISLSSTPYLNPLYFVNFEEYFGVAREKPELTQEVFEYLYSLKDFNQHKLFQIFGPASCLKLLLEKGYFLESKRMAESILELHMKNRGFTAPLLVMDMLRDHIEEKTKFEGEEYSKILHAAQLTKTQHTFARYLIWVINILQNEKYCCKFTADLPLKECRIKVLDDGATIQAIGKEQNHVNTLLSHSWYDGRIVCLDDPKITLCTHEECACLTHDSYRDGFIGKSSCKLNGFEAVEKRRPKKKIA